MLKRIEPSSTIVKISLKDIAISSFPIGRRLISICFWAPGHRYRQAVVRI